MKSGHSICVLQGQLRRPLYFHFRRQTLNGQLYNARGGMTLCLLPLSISISDSLGAFSVGVAICSTQDAFCKEKGRRVALARAEAPRAVHWNVNEHTTMDVLTTRVKNWAEEVWRTTAAQGLRRQKEVLSNIIRNDPRITRFDGWKGPIPILTRKTRAFKSTKPIPRRKK